jgi:hypothetical protein
MSDCQNDGCSQKPRQKFAGEGFCNLSEDGYTANMRPAAWFSLFVLSLVLSALADDLPIGKLSGYQAIDVANKSVPPSARNRVVGMYSEPSTNGLAPDIWHVQYIDPAVPFKKMEVKVVRGRVLDISHPRRMLDTLTGTHQFEKRKLKIDSDRALKNLLNDKVLSKLNLQSAQYWLERTGQGPAWRIRLWMPQLNKPGQLNMIGEVTMSTQTGETYKSNLRY